MIAPHVPITANLKPAPGRAHSLNCLVQLVLRGRIYFKFIVGSIQSDVQGITVFLVFTGCFRVRHATSKAGREASEKKEEGKQERETVIDPGCVHVCSEETLSQLYPSVNLTGICM